MKKLSAALLLWAGQVFAETAAAPAAAPQAMIHQIVPFILMFGVFYFILIRPQQKKQKLHLQFLAELKRGDMIVTNGGIIGTIKNLSEKFVTLEIDEGVCLKLLRNQVLEGANSLKEDIKPKA